MRVLRYKTRIGTMLRNEGCDDVAVAFDNETRELESEIKDHTSTVGFYAFLTGVVVSMLVFGGVSMYAISQHGDYVKNLFIGGAM